MFKLNKNKFKKKGFTLIEMMVAVSIFVIVAFIAVSTLLTLSSAYKKSQKMRLLMDNLNFSIQSMSLNIREGVSYNISAVCDNGGGTFSCFSFKSVDSWLNGESKTACFSQYLRSNGTRGIRKCENICPCNETSLDIISSDIDITKLGFKMTGSGQLKKVGIIIGGLAGKNAKESTTFFIQNTVSQRNLDN